MRTVDDSPLYSADFFADQDPWAYLNELRTESPVSLHRRADGYEFYALTTYEDVRDAYIDHVNLSSSYGTMIDGSFIPQEDTASGRMLIVADEPAHGRIKKPVKQSGFNRGMIESIGRTVSRNIATSLNGLSVGDHIDFTTHVAPELPKGVLEVLFGVGPADAAELLQATRTMIGYRDANYSGAAPLDSLVDAQQEILDFIDDLIGQRQRTGDDSDMIGFLASCVSRGEMTRDVALLNGLNVAVGGNETTPHTASLSIHTIDAHPDEWSKVTSGEADLDLATEEFLRWTSTNTYVQRLSLNEVSFGEATIPPRSFVTLWNMAANRDPDVFDRPDEFVIDRPHNRQIAFGAGVHRCIGAPVATLEIKMFLDALRSWDKEFAVLEPPRRLRSNFMLGFTELQVEVIPARKS